MKRAFSLVELSIVLVILGLLVGGVLSGQALIRAAQLRAVTTEYQRYYTATRTFRDKYFALPGDMTNATRFWGAADGSTGNTAACATTTTNDARTCNGDGDGWILTTTSSAEWYRYWQQLANAGLIEGNYTGIADVTLTIVPGRTDAPSKLSSSTVWHAYGMGPRVGNSSAFDYNYENIYYYFGWVGNNWNANMKPEEAWNIDTKMDDGKPGSGSVMANWSVQYGNSGTSCTTAANSAAITASYNLSDSGLDCGLFFIKL